MDSKLAHRDDLKRALLCSLLLFAIGFVGLLALKSDRRKLLTQPRADFRSFYWWSRTYRMGIDPRNAPQVSFKETGCRHEASYPSVILAMRSDKYL